jgi:hypothetical protein
MGTRNFNFEGVKLERGEDWFEPVLNIHTPFSPTLNPFLFAPLQLRSQKKLFLGRENTGRACAPPPGQVMPVGGSTFTRGTWESWCKSRSIKGCSGDKLMCSGNDNGNVVPWEVSSVTRFLWAIRISPIDVHDHLVEVHGDGMVQHVRKSCRFREWQNGHS